MNLEDSKNTSLIARIRSRAGSLLIVAALSLGPGVARAAVYTWSGAGPTNHGWLQQANYVGGTTGTYTFTGDDTIYYSNLSGTSSTAPVFGSAATIGTLEFGAETGANPITIAWQLPAKPVITLASGILVDAGAGANTINVPLTFSGSTTTLTNNSSNILVLSVPNGSGQLSLNGGAFHFQANNAGTFTGPTTVNTGATLRVLSTTTLAGSVDVKSGGTLGGRGTIGTTVIESGGILSPGVPTAPVNPISFSDSLSLASGSLTLLDLTNSANDSVNVGGLLTYGGELRLTLSDDFNTAGTYTLFGFNPGSESGSFDSFTLYNSLGEIGSLSLVSDVWSGEINGQIYSFDQGAGVLAVTAVPEPSTVGLVIVAFLGLLVFKSRKRIKSSVPPAESMGAR